MGRGDPSQICQHGLPLEFREVWVLLFPSQCSAGQTSCLIVCAPSFGRWKIPPLPCELLVPTSLLQPKASWAHPSMLSCKQPPRRRNRKAGYLQELPREAVGLGPRPRALLPSSSGRPVWVAKSSHKSKGSAQLPCSARTSPPLDSGMDKPGLKDQPTGTLGKSPSLPETQLPPLRNGDKSGLTGTGKVN